MPEVTGYEPGSPCWTELGSRNIEASKAFYGGLLGWGSYTIAHYLAGEYTVFTLGDVARGVAGMTPLADDAGDPLWTCFVTVADLEATGQAVRGAGGEVLADGVDVSNLGRLSLCVDTQGAGFALWQPYTVFGSVVVDEPGTVCWIELACRDLAEARRFYGDVLGWKASTEVYGAVEYTQWRIADRPVAGMRPIDEALMGTSQAHWTPYMAVTDCDGTAARVLELGGTVVTPPKTIPPGRYSILTDPAGARFAVIRPPCW